jgi:hypothetical protein
MKRRATAHRPASWPAAAGEPPSAGAAPTLLLHGAAER